RLLPLPADHRARAAAEAGAAAGARVAGARAEAGDACVRAGRCGRAARRLPGAAARVDGAVGSRRGGFRARSHGGFYGGGIERGYASATVQAVAARAQVATGSVYRHFPSKGELFAEVFRRASAHEVAVFAEVTGRADRPAAERVAAAVETFARRALAAPVRAY